MCGIAGIAAFRDGPPPEVDRVRRMCNAMIHRGPDEEGLLVEGRVGLGMRRLSIIDVAGGSQPIFNEDRTVRCVFNGEIYNFRELRDRLTALGHVFTTRTDTEVIVHAWEAFGEDFATHLNGMFAIALHDTRRNVLVLARDHIGIKPLYYALDDRALVWGSEIKVVLASGLVPRELDTDALGEYLCWEYVPGRRTLLKAVRKLEPASQLVVKLDAPSCAPRAYWDVPAPAAERPRSAAEWQEEIDATVRACVRRQLVSDVPLGAFLSGGVDSSLVVSQMGAARTFSIGFDDPSYNELGWSQRVARHLGVDHTTEVLSPDVLGLYETLVPQLDDPIGDFSIFPTYLVSRLARRHVTVSLSGDGGDELFAGYETYLADRAAHRGPDRVPGAAMLARLQRFVSPREQKKGAVNMLKRFAEGLGYSPALTHARWRLFLGADARRRLFTSEAARSLVTPPEAHILALLDRAGPRSRLDRSLYVDLKSYLCDNILAKVDRMSMAVSLEARVPLLDKELVELAFRVPAALKLEGRETKSILKRVAAAHVPRECVYRRKEGFSAPIKNWLGGTLRPLVDDLLAPARLRAQGLFDAGAVEGLRREHAAGRANHSHVLWALIVFQSWHRRWMEEAV